jgi:hypothetical protein
MVFSESKREYLQSFLGEGKDYVALFDSLKPKDRVRIIMDFVMASQAPRPVEYIVARRTKNKFGQAILHFNNADGSKQRKFSKVTLVKSPRVGVYPVIGDMAGSLVDLEKL